MKLMGKISVLLLSGLFSVSALAVQGDAAAGEKKAAPCAACHGQDGNSAAPTFPKLAGQGAAYTYKQLMDFKAGKRQNALMQGQVAGLSEQDMADLAAFYAGQTVKVGKADPALVEAGEKLYRGGNLATGVAACSGCHGPAGEGVDAAGFPALGGQHADYIESQLKAFRAAGRGDIGATKRVNDADGEAPGMMQTVAAKMSDSEIKAVASFIAGLGK